MSFSAAGVNVASRGDELLYAALRKCRQAHDSASAQVVPGLNVFDFTGWPPMSENLSTNSNEREERPVRSSMARRTRVWLGTVLSVVLLGLSSTALLAPAAQAAPQREKCWSHTYQGKVSVDKSFRRDGKLAYSATWHWCAVNGKVTKFVVDNTTPMPGTTKAYVDIRPVNRNGFGRSTYPIFINTTLGNKSDYHRFNLSGYGGILWP
jgi:hypothetical protein